MSVEKREIFSHWKTNSSNQFIKSSLCLVKLKDLIWPGLSQPLENWGCLGFLGVHIPLLKVFFGGFIAFLCDNNLTILKTGGARAPPEPGILHPWNSITYVEIFWIHSQTAVIMAFKKATDSVSASNTTIVDFQYAFIMLTVWKSLMLKQSLTADKFIVRTPHLIPKG